MQNSNNSHTKRGLGWYIDKILNLFLMLWGSIDLDISSSDMYCHIQNSQ